MDLHRVLAEDTAAASDAPAPSQPQPPPNPPVERDRDQEEAAAALLEMPRLKQNPHLQHVYDSEDGSTARDAGSPVGGDSTQSQPSANPTTVRRNANGSVSSVYSGNKIRHLKKEDGVPLWRKDIQYDFLKFVFEDDKRVFTKLSDRTEGHTFADIYLDAMAKSSKCSKILKDKLLTERPAAVNMAMVCLLVNVGRMNTTLNFFPEMRAQLRTYHSIPSLQAHQDPNAYKQLQDAPRLKSILKGATEDSEQPSTLEDIRAAPIPRTNPVNLIFVLSQFAPKISEIHFDVPRDFFDLVMKSGLSSRSRATAFLWLMWWYLESDFSEKDALGNPYGPGRQGSDGGLPVKTPQFDILTDEQAAQENMDTEEEKQFGEVKRLERISILQSDALAPVVTGPKRGARKSGPVYSVVSEDGVPSPALDQGFSPPRPGSGATGRGRRQQVKLDDGYSDTDRTRSISPLPRGSHASRAAPGMKIGQILNDDSPSAASGAAAGASGAGAAIAGPIKLGRGNWSKAKREAAAAANAAHQKQRQAQGLDAGPIAASGAAAAAQQVGTAGPHGFYLPLNGAEPSHKRTRPLTAHQIAVERYRKQKVDFILDRKIRKRHKAARGRRTREGAFARAWMQSCELPDDFDSEEELQASLAQKKEDLPYRTPFKGFAGFRIIDRATESTTPEIAEQELSANGWGEAAHAYRQAFSRMRRRFERWEQGIAPVKKKRVAPADAATAAAAAIAETVEEDGDGADDEEDELGDPGDATISRYGEEGRSSPAGDDDADEDMDDEDAADGDEDEDGEDEDDDGDELQDEVMMEA